MDIGGRLGLCKKNGKNVAQGINEPEASTGLDSPGIRCLRGLEKGFRSINEMACDLGINMLQSARM